MIISISGCQGQGKTTTLNKLKENGCNVIDSNVSRGILKEWGTTLNEVNSHTSIKKKFQNEILKRYSSLFSYDIINSKNVYFLERSFVDVFVYALIALGQYNQYSEWLDDYYSLCIEEQKKIKLNIFLMGRNIEPENDGTRSVNIHFRNSIEILMKEYLRTFGHDGNPNYVILHQSDLEKRCKQILELI